MNIAYNLGKLFIKHLQVVQSLLINILPLLNKFVKLFSALWQREQKAF
jgi:hypothetical protein